MSIDRLVLQMLMLDAGIVPDVSLNPKIISDINDPWAGWDQWSTTPPTSLDDMLKSLSDDDRKKAKRKFRKLWKKAEKAYGLDLSNSNKRFAPSNKSRRRAVVKRLLRDISEGYK